MAPPAVLLLHGQPGSAHDWDYVVPLLHGLRLLVHDRPGYDGSPAGGFRHNALAVARVLDREGVDRVSVAAHSWGAGVALTLAHERPDLVTGVVLAAPAAVTSSVVGLDRLLLHRPFDVLFTRLLGPVLARAPRLVAAASGSRITRAQASAIRAALTARNSRRDWDAWLVEQRALVDELPVIERQLPDIDVPTTILAGRRDLAVPLIAVRDLAVRLPNARLIELDAGHLVPFEAPQAVADAILAATT